MIRFNIAYRNFDDVPKRKDVYFHLSRTELSEHMDLEDRFKVLGEQLDTQDGEKVRDLTRSEIQDVLNLVKELMELSYGIRSDDGEHFHKSDEIWINFKDSAVYDATLWWLFEDPQRAIKFMSGIMPKDLAEKARAEAEERGIRMPQDRQPKQTTTQPQVVQSSVVDPEEADLAEQHPQETELEAARRRLKELEAQES